MGHTIFTLIIIWQSIKQVFKHNIFDAKVVDICSCLRLDILDTDLEENVDMWIRKRKRVASCLRKTSYILLMLTFSAVFFNRIKLISRRGESSVRGYLPPQE